MIVSVLLDEEDHPLWLFLFLFFSFFFFFFFLHPNSIHKLSVIHMYHYKNSKFLALTANIVN